MASSAHGPAPAATAPSSPGGARAAAPFCRVPAWPTPSFRILRGRRGVRYGGRRGPSGGGGGGGGGGGYTVTSTDSHGSEGRCEQGRPRRGERRQWQHRLLGSFKTFNWIDGLCSDSQTSQSRTAIPAQLDRGDAAGTGGERGPWKSREGRRRLRRRGVREAGSGVKSPNRGVRRADGRGRRPMTARLDRRLASPLAQ